MKSQGLVGLARVVLHRRERILMLEPRGKGIVGVTVRYHDEVRAEDDYFDDIPAAKVSPDMLELAVHILKSKESKFDPKKFEDRYDNALKKLIAAKQHGKKPPTAPPPPTGNVINLMDALRRSAGVKAAKPAGSAARRPKAERKRVAHAPKKRGKTLKHAS